MLLGREGERHALRRLVADARVGRSGVLALVGEPGIGKTALLAHAVELAEGMQILRARGVESEAAVPFAGLLELVRPALRALDRVPAPQAAALQTALALRPGGTTDRFAVGAATLSLVAAYAEESPVLALVDDAHWLDVPSAEALLFAIRRLLADPVAVVLAVRQGHASLLDGADIPILSVGGLDRALALELLAREAGSPIPGDVADRMYEATAGNPLAMLEVAPAAASLTGTGLAAPVPVSRRITEAFLHRTAPLPERTRRVLIMASASDGGELTVLARAAGSMGLDLADLTPAETAGVMPTAAPGIWPRRPSAQTSPRARPCSKPASARASGAPTRPPRPPSSGRRGSPRTTICATSSSTRPRMRRGLPVRSIGRRRSSMSCARGHPRACWRLASSASGGSYSSAAGP
jgi:hypothetical protein